MVNLAKCNHTTIHGWYVGTKYDVSLYRPCKCKTQNKSLDLLIEDSKSNLRIIVDLEYRGECLIVSG